MASVLATTLERSANLNEDSQNINIHTSYIPLKQTAPSIDVLIIAPLAARYFLEREREQELGFYTTIASLVQTDPDFSQTSLAALAGSRRNMLC